MLAEEIKKYTNKQLAALAEIPQADLRAFLADIDLTEYVEWCFDEADGMDIELMLLGMRVAVKAGMDDFVRDMLLESGRNDLVKVEGVRYLAERNRSFTAGVVISDFYRRTDCCFSDYFHNVKNFFLGHRIGCFYAYHSVLAVFNADG